MAKGDGRIVRPVLRIGLVTRWSIDVEWDEDVAATGWMVRQMPGHGRYQQTGQPFWRATGLESGTMYEFRVFTVDDDHDEASTKAAVWAWTLA